MSDDELAEVIQHADEKMARIRELEAQLTERERIEVQPIRFIGRDDSSRFIELEAQLTAKQTECALWKNSAEIRQNVNADLFRIRDERDTLAKRTHNQREEIVRLAAKVTANDAVIKDAVEALEKVEISHYAVGGNLCYPNCSACKFDAALARLREVQGA